MSSNGSDKVIFLVPAYNASLTIASSSASVVGSILLMVSFICWKENRTLSRLMITCLAVSDLLTAGGYLVMSAYYLQSGLLDQSQVNLSTVLERPVFDSLCKAQSFVTTTSSMWSFWWTTLLAFHLFISLVFLKLELSKRLFPLYALLSFGVPLLLTVPAAATGYLGVGCGTAAVTWCYIAVHDTCISTVTMVLEAVEGKVWEILALVCIAVMYLWIWCFLLRLRRKSHPESQGLLYVSVKTVPRAVDWKILALPVLFLFIRSWGTLRYLLSLDSSVRYWLVVDERGKQFGQFLASMQCIFDSSQGWVNAIVFLFLSKAFYSWVRKQGRALHNWFLRRGYCRCPCRYIQDPPTGHLSRASYRPQDASSQVESHSSQITLQ